MFGEWMFFDVKVMSYFILALTTFFVPFGSDKVYRSLLLAFGGISYLQIKFSSEWINSLHQIAYVSIAVDDYGNLPYFELVVKVGLILQMLIITLMFFLLECYIKRTTTI